MIWIFDSSPLIYLNKVGLNWIFEQLEGEKIIPTQVYEQVVTQGKKQVIFSMVKSGKLKKEEARDKVDSMIRKGFRLGHEEYVEFLNLLEKV